ncbi:MAG: hypothetical protein ACD_15C00143G0002 [uncultured bacterium]|nr:MAG: hypothetical protein ACD_15C00143G0002 [uncultured bacterium]
MFSHSRKNKNRKELEYNKMRSVSKKEENFRWLRSVYRIFFYFLTAVFFAVAFYAIFFSPFLAIEQISITGTKKLDFSAVSEAAESVYGGKYLGILPKRNFLLFPKKAVAKKLTDDFKRISKVEIEKHFPQRVTITISERESLLLWCDNSGECFIVDENGLAYQNVKPDSKEVLENDLVRIVSQEDRKVFEEEKLFDGEKVKFLLNVRDVIRKGSSVELTGEARVKSRIAEEVVLKSSEGWEIYVSTAFPLEKSSKMLGLFLQKQLSPEDRSKLEYVDLRVENRIYYKLNPPAGGEEESKEGEESKEAEENQDKPDDGEKVDA